MEKEKQNEMYLLKRSKTMFKWMKWLLYLYLAEKILPILDYIPMTGIIGTVLPIFIRYFSAAGLIIFFICRNTEKHFKWVVFWETAYLICDILGRMIGPISYTAAFLLIIAAIVFSAIWEYHEYWGYSSIMEGINDQLSGNWKTLFKFNIIVGVGYFILYMLNVYITAYIAYVLIRILAVVDSLCVIGGVIAQFVIYYRSIKEMKAYIETHSGETV